jgi:putative glutamine amidotransferase
MTASIHIGIPAFRAVRMSTVETGFDPYQAVRYSDIAAVYAAGAIPVLIPPVFAENQAEDILGRLDGLYLAGGVDISPELYPGEPESLSMSWDIQQDQAELALARTAIRIHKPILAICRGVQLLNVSLSGTLIDDISTRVPGSLKHDAGNDNPLDSSAHPVHIEAGSRLAKIFGKTELFTNSFHHQAVKAAGRGLVVTAHAPDGIIEAVGLPCHPFCLGVQWHPEEKVGNRDDMSCIFEAFVSACKPVP